MFGWGNGCLWCQTTQHPLRLSLSQCGHVSVISHVSYSSACSFTALLPWLQDGRGGGGGGSSLRWRWTGSWTENVEFGEQISCLANAEEVWGQQSVDADSPERRTLPCWDELRKNYYDSQLLKNVSHLNCARTMCLHHLNSQIETHICCSQCRQWCMNPSIWLLSVFLKKKK